MWPIPKASFLRWSVLSELQAATVKLFFTMWVPFDIGLMYSIIVSFQRSVSIVFHEIRAWKGNAAQELLRDESIRARCTTSCFAYR